MSQLNQRVVFGAKPTFDGVSKLRAARAESPAGQSAVSGAPWAVKYHRILLLSDAIVLIIVLLFATYLRFGVNGGEAIVGRAEVSYPLVSVAVAACWMAALGLYRSRDPKVVGLGADEYKRVVSATVALLGSLAIVALLFKADVARGYFALAFPLGIIGLMGSRWTLRHWLTGQRNYGHFLSRVIVLGGSKDVRYVIGQIEKKSGAAYQVIGAALTGTSDVDFLMVGNNKIPVVSRVATIVDAVERLRADAVIVAGPVKGGSRFIQQLGWELEESATELVLATGLTSVAGPRIHSRPVEGLPLMHVELPQYAGAKHVLKRLLDIALSFVALVVIAPILVVLALIIHKDSPGPVIFRQERIGRSGQPFTMYKFRSMVQSAEDDLATLLEMNEGAGPLFKIHDDPRVTRSGRWMRKYSLDELPQFWNVLVGNMSLVGPRPPLRREVDTYKSRVQRRLYIKPGLTGMWQINGRSELNWKDSVRLDLYYVENWSLTGDVIILWRTARMLLKSQGAY